MSDPVSASQGAALFGGEGGVRRPTPGRPTSVPGGMPAFRGRKNTPGSNVAAPSIRTSYNRQDRGTNVTIPYARVVPLHHLENIGRLSPGDVAFCSTFRVNSNMTERGQWATYNAATGNWDPKPNVTDRIATLPRLVGVDWMNKMLGGRPEYDFDKYSEMWSVGHTVLLGSPSAPVTDEAGTAGALVADITIDPIADNIADNWRQLTFLREWACDGVVLSNDEPGCHNSNGDRDGQLFNICVQGRCMANNGYQDFRGEGVASEHRSYGAGVGYNDGGESHTSDFFSHFGGSYYNSYPLQMFDRKLRPSDTVYVGLVGTKRPMTATMRRKLVQNTPLLKNKYDRLRRTVWVDAAGNTDDQPVFDPDTGLAVMEQDPAQPVGIMRQRIGPRPWSPDEALFATPDPANGDASRNAGGCISQAISSFYTFHFAFFSSQQAWLDARTYNNFSRSGAPIGHAPNADRGDHNDPVWTNIRATKEHGFAEPPTKKSKVHYEDAVSGKTFDPYIGPARREFEGMIGAWKIGKVHDISAMRKDQYIGGPSDTTTGITVSVDIEFKGWRQLRRDFDRPDIGMRMPGARAWIAELRYLDQASFGVRGIAGQAVPQAEILSVQNQDAALGADADLAFESERFFQWPTRYEPLTDEERLAYTQAAGAVAGLTVPGGKLYDSTPINPTRFESVSDILDATGDPAPDRNATPPILETNARRIARENAERLRARAGGVSGSDQPIVEQRTEIGIQGQPDLSEGIPEDAPEPMDGPPGSVQRQLHDAWDAERAAFQASGNRARASALEFPLYALKVTHQQQMVRAFNSVAAAKVDRVAQPATGGIRERILTNREIYITDTPNARALTVAEATALWDEYAPGVILPYADFVNTTIGILNGAAPGGAATQQLAVAAFLEPGVPIPAPIAGGRGVNTPPGRLEVQADIADVAGINPGLAALAKHWMRMNLMGYDVWGVEKEEFDDYVDPDIDSRLVRNPADTRFFSASDTERLNSRIFAAAVRLARGISSAPPAGGGSSAVARASMPPPAAPASTGSVAAAVCASSASSSSATVPKARGKSPMRASSKAPVSSSSAIPTLGASPGGATAALAAAQRASPAASPSIAPPAASTATVPPTAKPQQPKRRTGGAAATADVFSSIFSGASSAGSQVAPTAPVAPAPTSSAADDTAPSPSEGSEGGSGSAGSRSRVRRRGDGR